MSYRLAVIPSDPLEDYVQNGLGDKLANYYNPLNFFDQVFCFSPLEKEERQEFGMTIIPTKDKQLPNRLKEYDIDVIHAYGGYWPCDMATNFRYQDVPVVVSIHDLRMELVHQSLEKANHVFVSNSFMLKKLKEKINNLPSAYIIPNQIDIKLFQPASLDHINAFRKQFPFEYLITYVGRKSAEKNLETILKALVQLPDVAFLAIGELEDNSLNELIQELDVQSQCFFWERMDNQQLPLVYSSTDIYCQISHSEAMSYSCLEAMACESACIFSAMIAENFQLESEKQALIMEQQEDVDELVEKVKKILQDPLFQNRIGKEARVIAEQYQQETVDQLRIDIYQKILTNESDSKI